MSTNTRSHNSYRSHFELTIHPFTLSLPILFVTEISFNGKYLAACLPSSTSLHKNSCQCFQGYQENHPLRYLLTTAHNTDCTLWLHAFMDSSRMVPLCPIGIPYTDDPLPQVFGHVVQGNQLPALYLLGSSLVLIRHIHCLSSLHSTYIIFLYHAHMYYQIERWNQYQDEYP